VQKGVEEMSNMHRPNNIDNEQQEERFEDPFWMEYYPKLQRYCHFLAQNKWDGDDIAQETYLKALKYSSHHQNLTTALLNKIAYHHWIDILRKRKHEINVADFAESILNNQVDDITNSVELLLNQFTPKQAVIFLLKEAFQYQLKEIAAILETTEMAVKSNLHRVKKRLEKVNQSFSAEIFWDEEEREQFSSLFYEALENQDPTVLIHSIPDLKSVFDVPKLVSRKLKSIETYSPSSTLYMAA
jgi:RNA polymerase sigma factor (sigma-70 family)